MITCLSFFYSLLNFVQMNKDQLVSWTDLLQFMLNLDFQVIVRSGPSHSYSAAINNDEIVVYPRNHHSTSMIKHSSQTTNQSTRLDRIHAVSAPRFGVAARPDPPRIS
jgi:hypothetical protein